MLQKKLKWFATEFQWTPLLKTHDLLSSNVLEVSIVLRYQDVHTIRFDIALFQKMGKTDLAGHGFVCQQFLDRNIGKMVTIPQPFQNMIEKKSQSSMDMYQESDTQTADLSAISMATSVEHALEEGVDSPTFLQDDNVAQEKQATTMDRMMMASKPFMIRSVPLVSRNSLRKQQASPNTRSTSATIWKK